LPAFWVLYFSSISSSGHISVLTKGQLVGIIVAGILGLIFLFVLGLFLCLWRKGRTNRQFNTLVPLDEDGDYDVLSPSDVEGYRVAGDLYGAPDGYRAPGEGSPRHSGDEASSFLRQSRGGTSPFAETSAAGAVTAAAMSQVPTGMGVSHAIQRIPPPITNSNSSGSQSSSKGSHASGFGVLIERPKQGLGLPSMPEDPQDSGTTLSAADLHRLDQENDFPDDPDMYEGGEYTGAYAYANDPLLVPPRIVNPEYSPLNADFPSDVSEAEVLTAERRTVGSRPELPVLPEFGGQPSPRHSSGLLGAIGLGLDGLANLGRRSWFKNLDSHRHSPDFTVEPFTEQDIEIGRAMLSPDTRVDAGPDAIRPKSSSSARSGTSGGTIYHDALTSIPDTPSTLPRAATPAAAHGGASVTEPLRLSSPLSRPPAYNEDPVDSPGLTDNLNSCLNFVPDSDILDMPAPAALHHFTSVSSLKETTTGSSLDLKILSFPPGLDTIRPVGWSDIATDSSPEVSPFGGAFLNNSLSSSGRITIDLLEDAPPGAELGWRSIASAGFGDAGRRGTFGLFIDQTGFMSEQGSLHSMRSHFNPSVRSTGSAPASRRDGSSSMSSASSRPSAHSLPRTGSISSDGRRRHHTNSPALSAFGYSQMRSSPLSNNNRPAFDDPLAIIGSLPRAHVSPDKSSTIRSLASVESGSAATMMNSPISTVEGVELVRTGSTSQFSASSALNAPWAAGLDNDWIPAA